ncbi:exodeoxyribonuclease V subunit beta [Oceanicoccus sp. KOV_DT_Chl]|uniref:UvrD-helicase domain-containing protein n=1 Tax=Oceanicoccus sp. KOV_DT_Chl TaxID=1904639 RepID=UPI000C798D0C|nr:UvrD-helicase domain-containing protein [Oceanicoccus sp. KOV_DT_Chl]
MMLPVDHDQRLAALNPLRSICVTAPAGSGKTELLSQRVLKLLSRAQQPEEILAITFTRKAAAEMHHRIIAALQFALVADEPEAGHKQLTWRLAKDALMQNDRLGWNLLSNTSRLKIQTIDSLCANLTRQMPILSNFGAQPKIADNPQPYYQTAVHNLLDKLESNHFIADDLAGLLVHVDNDMAKLERLLITLLQKRDQWLLHLGIGQDVAKAKLQLEAVLEQVHRDVLSALHAQLMPWAVELLPLMDYAGCNLQWQNADSAITSLAGNIDLPAPEPECISQWLAIAELLLTKTNEWRKSVDRRSGFPTETEDGDKALAKTLKTEFMALLANLSLIDSLRANLLDLRFLPATKYEPSQWQMLESLSRLLPLLVAELTLVFQQHGEVDYSQISMAALQALGDGLRPSELAMKLDYRLSHILVDEFQDTASTQFQLLQRLVEGWDEYNAAHPEQPNTLFIVGDGMQSIYGFRQANVGLFLEAKKHGVNGVLLDDLRLTVNFRSDPAVVNWVNNTFSEAFPKLENLSRGAVPFEFAEAFNPATTDSSIKVLGFAGDNARDEEAAQVVKLVQQFQAENANGSVAILVRSRGHLQAIIPALHRAGIQWSATDIDPLASYGLIKDLLTLTKALLNISDDISWAALLRTPWLGLNNHDLHSLLVAETRLSVYSALQSSVVLSALSEHGRNRLSAVLPILNAAVTGRQRHSFRVWVEGVWMALGGAACVASSDEFVMVDDYLDMLESHQQGESIASIDAFEQSVSQLYARPQSTHHQLSIMTIHKSKGLEFDCVILPGLARAPRSDDKSLLLWREYLSHSVTDTHVQNGLLISPLGASGDVDDKIYQHLRYEQSQSTQLENTRLLYVAATRAIRQLYCLLTVELDARSGEPKSPAKSSLIIDAWSALVDQVQWFVPTAASNNEVTQFGLDFESVSHQGILQRLIADWRAPLMSSPNPLQEFYLDFEYDSAGDNIPDIITDSLPVLIGTVSHWVLEVLANQGVDFWRSMDAQQQSSWLQALLHYHQTPPEMITTASCRIVQAVNNTVNDQKGLWLLANDHLLAFTELPMLSSFAGLLKQKVIDRCFIDSNHDVWIVDYKTSMPLAEESKEQFLSRELSHHRSQLQDYKLHLSVYLQQLLKDPTSAIAGLNFDQLTIRTALYFTHYPQWLELDL